MAKITNTITIGYVAHQILHGTASTYNNLKDALRGLITYNGETFTLDGGEFLKAYKYIDPKEYEDATQRAKYDYEGKQESKKQKEKGEK